MVKRKEMAYNKSEIGRSGVDNVATQYQVFVNDISWSDKPLPSYQSKKAYQGGMALPRQITFDIPANVVEQANRDPKQFNDIVETFICNTLTRKFMYEVHGCQIWLLF